MGGGLGGPARTLAHEFGARVTVLDLTEEYCEVGAELTPAHRARRPRPLPPRRRAGPAISRRELRPGLDAAHPMNIEDKECLYESVRRVLRPGGRLALHEVMAGPAGPVHFPVPWSADGAFSFLRPPETIRGLLAGLGLRETAWVDVSAAALSWFRERTAAARGATAPPPLGLHLLLLERPPAACSPTCSETWRSAASWSSRPSGSGGHVMRIEVICTGDEVLTGKIVNTNFSYISQKLEDVGLSVAVGDDGRRRPRDPAARLPARGRARRRGHRQRRARPHRRRSLAGDRGPGRRRRARPQRGVARAHGGLLPPAQPRDAAQQPQAGHAARRRRDPRQPDRHRLRLRARHRQGALLLHARACRASCAACSRSRSSRGCWRKSGVQTAIYLKRFHSYGLGESHVDSLLAGVEDLVPDGSVKLGFRAHYPQLETKLTVRGADMDDVRRKLAPVEQEVRKRLGNFILAEDDQTLEGVVLDELARRQRLARARRNVHERPDRRAHRPSAGRREGLPPRRRRARPAASCAPPSASTAPRRRASSRARPPRRWRARRAARPAPPTRWRC